MQLFINNWQATLLAPAAAADLTLTVDSAEAALLTGLGSGDYYLLTLAVVDDDGVETAWEIVRVTGVAAGVLTVERAQEDTDALDWEIGAVPSARATAGTLEDLRPSGGAELSDEAPLALGEPEAGVGLAASRDDHVHAMPSAADVGAIPAADKGEALGVAPLDSSAKVPAIHLPSFVDDVIEVANFAALPATGEAGKIYVTLDTSKVWRWGGSSYTEISPSPGSTDSVTEGSTNLYHTAARVLATALAGLSTAATTTITAADSILAAIGKLAGRLELAFSRANHTGTQASATISDFTEAAQDSIASFLVAGSNITLTHNDTANTLTVATAATPLSSVILWSGSKTLGLTDNNSYHVSQDATAQVATLPAQATVAWAADTEINLEWAAVGAVTVTAAAGVTINGVVGGSFQLAGRGAVATLKRKGVNNWTLVGVLIEAPSALRITLKLTANQSIPAATTTIIAWDAVEVSDAAVAAAWVSGADILKVAGYTKMRVTANISYLNNTTGNRFGTVWKDGAGGAFAGQLNARCNAVNLTQRSEINGASAILSTADFTTLQVATYQSSGAALDLYAAATWASVEFWK